MEDGVAVLQVQAPASIQFHYHLNRAVDPSAVKEEADENRIGEKTLRFMLEGMKYQLELEYPESGLLARVKIPFEQAGYASVHRADRGQAGGNRVII
jgi:hypothetical protein